MSYINSFSQTTIILILIPILFVSGIYLIKRHFNQVSDKVDHLKNDFNKKYSARTKFSESNIFQWRTSFFQVGMILSTSFAILAFNYTERTIINPNDDHSNSLEIVDNEPIPVTYFIPPKPKVPPVIELSLIEIPIETVIQVEEDFTPSDTKLSETKFEDVPEVVTKSSIPHPAIIPPPKPEIEDEITFIVVEEMPRYPGCEDSNLERGLKRECADKAMLEYIYKHIKYPSLARSNRIEGKVFLHFVIDKKGNMKNLKIRRDIGGGCGQEALRVIKKMASEKVWISGKQRGKPVQVEFNLPIHFKLSD